MRASILTATEWAEALLDVPTMAVPVSDGPSDPLGWPGYLDSVHDDPAESLQTFTGTIDGNRTVLAVFDFTIRGGSMGTRAGKRLRAAYDAATDAGLPIIVVTATGGARMQEGMMSLSQMPGVLAAAADHTDAGLVQFVVATHPTTGGVFASLATTADFIIAEPDAYLGFAGPRVRTALSAKGTLSTSAEREKPTTTAQQHLEAGQIDAVVPREQVRQWLAAALTASAPNTPTAATGRDQLVEPFTDSGSSAVAQSRADDRARSDQYLAELDVFVELRGDRAGGATPHTRVGITRIAGRRTVVIAQDHGPVTAAGFRLAIRGARLAERIGAPVVTLIDTRGAEAGAAADAAGTAGAIAQSIKTMLSVDTPTLGIVIGEGGSGGAIALAATDTLWIQRSATFSVIAPEGAASILYRHPEIADNIAEHLKLRSSDLVDLHIADRVIPDGVTGFWDAVGAWIDSPIEAGPGPRRTRWRRIADGA